MYITTTPSSIKYYCFQLNSVSNSKHFYFLVTASLNQFRFSGAFIVIDSMLERMKHEKTVDVYGHVTCLRAQRNYMVQTEDQYIFIHDALLEVT